MVSEDDLLPISALQHLVFCARQWALIHLEGLWEENSLTVEGRFLHDRADAPETEVRGDLRIARGLRLRSLRLGLVGRADVVEFHRLPKSEATPIAGQKPLGLRLEGVSGLWKPHPVEYKRGKPKTDHSDEVQLCAQALSLEEMFSVSIPSGALFYGRLSRRTDVSFDDALRSETEATAARLHELTFAGKTPPARYEKRCRSCSLVFVCLPKATGAQPRARKYLSSVFTEVEKASGRESL